MQRGSLKKVLDRRGVSVWRAQWRENGKGRTRILGRCLDVKRGDARAELDKIVAAVNGKPCPPNPCDTVRRFVENEYLAQRTKQWKGSTAITTESLLKLHVIDELGDRPLAAITRKELQMLLDRKAAAGLSASIVGHIRWQLRAIFRMAKSDGLIALEPAESLYVAVTKAVDKRVIGLDQIVRAQMALPIRERLIFRLAACEGMRPGEIVALQIGDFTDRGISVERRVYCGQIDTPKSYKSRRVIPPTPITRDVLRNYLELVGERRPDAWMFPSEAGTTPISYANVYKRRIRPALRKIGLGDVNFQVLRRTWVTEFSKVEADPHVRARVAGHSVDVHENEYRQGNPEADLRSMERLGKHFVQ